MPEQSYNPQRQDTGNADEARRGFMRQAVALAREAMAGGGGPFGAVVVRNGLVIGRGRNRVVPGNDPTAHAEVEAIRDAAATIDDFSLAGCELYSSCMPCPMCLSASYWAQISRIYYAAPAQLAEEAGFLDEFIARELKLAPGARSLPAVQLPDAEAAEVMRAWWEHEQKTPY